MPDQYEAMWAELGMNLERYAELRAAGAPVFKSVVLAQKNRPEGMRYFDDLMRGLHTWRVKELADFRHAGGKVAGIFCVFVPEEIVLAAGAVPVSLCSGSAFSIPAAERILPANTCALIKSAYGFELERVCPYLHLSDLVIGETTCDGKKKMYELMGRGRDVFVIETPQTRSEAAHELFTSELHRLVARMQDLTGNEITPEKLAVATELHERKRAAMARIAATRSAPNPPISGIDALLVNQLSFIDEHERFIANANALAEELEARVASGEGAYEAPDPRILITGCPMALPNWKLPNVVETSGGMVVGEESCVGSRYYEQRVDRAADSLDEQLRQIAARQLRTNCASFTPNDERLADIVRLADELHVDGVIQYTLGFCHTFAFEAVKVSEALKGRGIPCLSLETDYSPSDVAQLRLRVAAFLEMVGGR